MSMKHLEISEEKHEKLKEIAFKEKKKLKELVDEVLEDFINHFNK